MLHVADKTFIKLVLALFENAAGKQGTEHEVKIISTSFVKYGIFSMLGTRQANYSCNLENGLTEKE